MEVIDLQSQNFLKDKFKDENLIEFYKCLPYDQYVHLRKFAHEFTSFWDQGRPVVALCDA